MLSIAQSLSAMPSHRTFPILGLPTFMNALPIMTIFISSKNISLVAMLRLSLPTLSLLTRTLLVFISLKWHVPFILFTFKAGHVLFLFNFYFISILFISIFIYFTSIFIFYFFYFNFYFFYFNFYLFYFNFYF